MKDDLREFLEAELEAEQRKRWEAERKAGDLKAEMIFLGVFGVLPMLTGVGFIPGLMVIIGYCLFKLYVKYS